MTGSWVVDASVAAKWVLPEADSDVAVTLRGHRLTAPEFIDIECANIVWKAMRRKEITAAEALELQAALREAPIDRLPDAALLSTAMLMATVLDHPVYDCLYLAASRATGRPLVTVDRRLRHLRWDGVQVVTLGDLS